MKNFIYILFIFCCLFNANFLYAQTVKPMVFELQPSGSKSSTSMEVKNTTSSVITIEVVASKLEMDEKGKETLTPTDKDFLIYPPQSVIPAGKSQIIRVKYIGNADINKSQAYRISIKQLPIDLKTNDVTGVGMVYHFNTLVNIVPKKATAKPKLVSLEQSTNNKWKLTLKNDGDKYVRLSKTSWIVSDKSNGSSRELNSIDVAKLTNKNLLLPESKLIDYINPIEGFKLENISISIKP